MPGDSPPAPSSRPESGARFWWRAALLVLAGLWIYWPALHGNWLWDDTALVTHNETMQSLAGLGKIWTATPDWALTSTLFWVEWHLWGAVPYGYHAVSFALHLAGGFLVWRLLSRLGLRQAWFGALLFVVHPLAVESAAWISETKNTLSLPLALLAFDAWLDRDEGRGRWGYARSLFFYLAAMLAKTSVIMLPAVLLLYAWWKRGRVERREIVATLPFFAVALVLGGVSYYFQHVTALGDAGVAASVGFPARIGGAALALLFYLGKFILPVGLLPIYPAWKLDGGLLLDLAVATAALALGGWWVSLRGWWRSAVFGLGFFVLNLLPVLGLVRMLYLDISPVADHFVYLPMIGLIGLAVAGLDQFQLRLGPKPLFVSIFAVWAVLLVLSVAGRGYAGLYVNHQSLWGYTLARNPDAWPAHNNLGDVYLATGRLADAQREYETTIRLNPSYPGAHSNLGTTLLALGRGPDAVQEYRQAVTLQPDSALYHFNLGIGLARMGQIPEAIAEYEAAIKLDPDNARAHNNLGNALLLAGQVDDAIAECEAALRLDPTMALAHANLADAFMRAGRYVDAASEYGEALKSGPGQAYLHYNFGDALVRSGRPDEAVEQYRQAIALDPGSAAAWSNLGVALARTGHVPEAMDAFRQALRIDPKLVDAQKNLTQLQQMQQQHPAAK